METTITKTPILVAMKNNAQFDFYLRCGKYAIGVLKKYLNGKKDSLVATVHTDDTDDIQLKFSIYTFRLILRIEMLIPSEDFQSEKCKDSIGFLCLYREKKTEFGNIVLEPFPVFTTENPDISHNYIPYWPSTNYVPTPDAVFNAMSFYEGYNRIAEKDPEGCYSLSTHNLGDFLISRIDSYFRSKKIRIIPSENNF